MNRPNLAPPTATRVAATLAPLGLVALMATPLVWKGVAPAELHAAASHVTDVDGDGLVDAQERILGTHPRRADTDGDGFSDAEELARRSGAQADGGQPEQRPIDVGMSAYARGDQLRVVILVYAADGTLEGKTLTVSALAGERVVQIPSDVLARIGRVERLPTRDPQSALFSIEIPIAPQTVYRSGQLSISASVAAPDTGVSGVADVLDLVQMEGTICLRVSSEELGLGRMEPPSTSASSSSGGGGSSKTKVGGGGAFVPIYFGGGRGQDEDGGDNASDSAGICVQSTETVGGGRGQIVSEVVSSECVEGWDGFCGSECAGQVGSLVRSIDPVVFAGG